MAKKSDEIISNAKASHALRDNRSYWDVLMGSSHHIDEKRREDGINLPRKSSNEDKQHASNTILKEVN